MNTAFLIFAKLFGIAWMLGWFFVLFKIFVNNTNEGRDPFAGILATGLIWVLVGLCPILIVKLGWWLISGRPVQ